MKKLNYLLLGAAGLLMASCASEDLKSPANGDGTQITINLPGNLGTRAGDDVTWILNYAIYDSNQNLVEEDSKDFQGTSTNINTNLLTGKAYTLAFFVQNSEYTNVYTFSASDKTVTVNYDEMNEYGSDANNAGAFDCFYNTFDYPAGGLTSSVTVTLNRPVAQINWGTNDLGAESVKQIFGAGMYATLSTDAYSKFSLLDGSLTGEKGKVTLGAFTAPGIAYPVGTTYSYVAMQYVLAGQTSDLYDLNLNVSNTAEASTGETTDVVVTSAPLQANYKTNIYGSLLTDNVELNVELGEWGGSILDPQELGEEVYKDLYQNGKIYTITSETGLSNYINEVLTSKMNGNTLDKYAMQGYTVVLEADLDMNNYPDKFTPFHNASATFDGQGHTIKNLNVDVTGQMDGSAVASAGFMSHGIGTVQNINFTNATIKGNYNVGVAVGDGDCAMINNVHVDGAVLTSIPRLTSSGSYDDGNNCGGIVGYLCYDGGNAWVKNSSVANATISAYRKVGGIAGIANGAAIVQNNTVTNTTITANQKLSDGTYADQKDFEAGQICGSQTSNAIVTNNTATGVSVTTISSTGETTASVASQAALQAAVGNPNASITLQPGTYTPPTNVAEGVTFTGTPDAILSITQGKQFSGYTNVTFEGVSFTSNTTTLVDTGFIHSSGLKYKNCIFNGMFIEYSTGLTYDGCTFNVDGNIYGVWTYGASDITFSDCNFNTDGKAVLLYSRNATPITVNFSECNFKAAMPQNGDGAGDGKAAIQINGGDPVTQTPFIVNINKCKATGFSDLTLSGNGLWSYKNGVLTKVTVDGEQVYNTINNN